MIETEHDCPICRLQREVMETAKANVAARKEKTVRKPIEDYTREELLALIGEPAEGSHPDEWLPRDSTWHKERQNALNEIKGLRSYIESQKE